MQDRNFKHWSSQEDETTQTMLADGKGTKEIAIALNRSRRSVQDRLYWLNMSPEKREQRRARVRGYRPANGLSGFAGQRVTVHFDRSLLRPDPRALADREARYQLAPRDLTAAFFGDPLPGFSALDRR